MSSASSIRRVKKWHAPASPKIINLPRRHCYTSSSSRRRKARANVAKSVTEEEVVQMYNYRGKLENLFGVEREFRPNCFERPRRQGTEEVGQLEQEKWRFQAEILRAECNFLRMERKFALKKLEKNRVRIQRTLESALQNLASRKKRLCEGKNMEVVLEEEIKELAEKLEELQTSYNESEDQELRKCKNFDKKASCLQRRLERLGGLTDDDCSNKEMKKESNGEVNEDGLFLNVKSQNKSTDVETLGRKMEGLSKEMIDRMEREYGSVINNSAASSASTSKRIDFPDHLSLSNRFSNHLKEPLGSQETNKCSGRCKLLVRRIVEQVRAETEQWSQMQQMLGQLRQEMEELQTSKDFWEAQALASTNEMQSLVSNVEEWREKAVEYETKANKLQKEVDSVKSELEKFKKDQAKEMASTPKKTAMLSLGKQIERETKNGLSCRMKGPCDVISSSNRHEKVEQNKKELQPLSLGKQLAREKQILISRLKENRKCNNEISGDGRRKGYNLVRSPLKDIGNSTSSSMTISRQNSNAIFPLHCPDPARLEDSS
uniref:myosin heavy chain, embryonic smooth muscle isoform n=1 Tax=Erigeron canadensis TaxID=72917 RepID=UPI001CB99DD5|nr:myosin heavy chain, embryonic smooth muscle isoform [Erigeron canadensis]